MLKIRVGRVPNVFVSWLARAEIAPTRQPLQKSDGKDERPTLTAVLCVLLPRHARLLVLVLGGRLPLVVYLLIYPLCLLASDVAITFSSLHPNPMGLSGRDRTGQEREGLLYSSRHNRVVSLVHSRIDRSKNNSSDRPNLLRAGNISASQGIISCLSSTPPTRPPRQAASRTILIF